MYINIKSKLALWSPVLFLTGFISDICQGAAKDTNSESIIGTSVLVKKNNEWQYHGVRGLFFLEERKKKAISSLFLMSVTKSKRFLGQEEY
ncbi:MAG: hypothetical protein V8S95_12310 [Odoribacter sp.]